MFLLNESFYSFRQEMDRMILLLTFLYLVDGYRIPQATDINEDHTIGTLHLKNLGNAKVFCRHSLIELEIEMDDTQNLQKEIKFSLKLMDDICEATRYRQLCQYTTKEIKLLERTLNEKEKTIQLLSRHKRIRRQTEELEELLEKSIKLNDFSYSEIRQSIEELRRITNNTIKSHNKRLNDIDYINFILLSQLIELNLKRRTSFLDLILEIAANSNHKKLFDLLPAKDLQAELNDLQAKLRDELCHMPFNMNPEEILLYLSLANIGIELFNNRLTIVIEIPTYYETTFKLLEAVPIPFTYKWDSYVVPATFPYALVYKRNDTFQTFAIPITLEEKIKCTQFLNLHLCAPSKDLQVINTAVTGEVENIFRPDFVSCSSRNPKDFITTLKKCSYQKVPHINQIIQLSECDYFVYIVTEAVVTIACEDDTRKYTMNFSNVIKDIDDHCAISFEHGVYPEHKNSVLKSKYQSNVNLAYTIRRTDLVHTDPPVSNTFDTYKNFQSEHMELHDQIRVFNQRNRVTENIFKSKEFILIASGVLILLTCTWVCIIYCSLNFEDRLSNVLKNLKRESPLTLMPGLKWNFNLVQNPDIPPQLPPKHIRRSRDSLSSLKRSPTGIYDRPRTADQRENLKLSDLSPRSPDLCDLYATLHRKTPTVTPTPV